MKILVSGHRRFKLDYYNIDWIKEAINVAIQQWVSFGMGMGLSGMASGVDLWFCESCLNFVIPYCACPPFEEQENLMYDFEEKEKRAFLLSKASNIRKIRNSSMVELCDGGIIIFDGNKGGTHNVFQQMIEKDKPFIWINPVGEKIWQQF